VSAAVDDARRARAETGLFAVGTIAAALFAGPVPWSASLLAVTMTVVALSLRGAWAPFALAIGAAPWWLEALDGAAGIVLAGLLAVAALVGSGSPRVAAVLAGAALFEGIRLHVLEDRGLVAQTEASFVIVGGLALAALVRGTRASPLSYGAVVCAALLGGASAARALGSPPADPGDVVRETRLDTLRADVDSLVAHPSLGLFALSLRPSWHALAMALVPEVGLERVLSAGWLADGAPVDSATRIAAARWLERHGRGGEGERLLARDATPDVRWWLALFRRSRGWETEDANVVAAPRGIVSVPGWIELEARNPIEVVFEADGPLRELAIERRQGPLPAIDSPEPKELQSGETFERSAGRTGGPFVVLQVDGVEHVAELAELGTVRLPVALPAGPHRVWVRSDVPGLVGRLGAF
jgi:hypothetical protein